MDGTYALVHSARDQNAVRLFRAIQTDLLVGGKGAWRWGGRYIVDIFVLFCFGRRESKKKENRPENMAMVVPTVNITAHKTLKRNNLWVVLVSSSGGMKAGIRRRRE